MKDKNTGLRKSLLETWKKLALARWLGCLEHHPVHQNIAGLIPGQGIYRDCRLDPWSRHVQEAND